MSAPLVRNPVPSGHVAPSGGIAVSVVATADDISPAEWLSVTAGCGFYSSPRWLRFLEDDSWHDVWYLTARAHDGDLLGVLPVYLAVGGASAGVDSFYDPAVVFGGLDESGDPSRWRPTLLGGGRAGYHTQLLLREGLSPRARRRVLTALVKRLNKLADAWGAGSIACMYLDSAHTRELEPVLGSGPPLITDVDAVIELEGITSFDAYLGRLSGNRRRRIRAEVREFAESGLRLRTVRLSDFVDSAASLLADHHARYGHADTPDMLAAHLRQQAEHLDDISEVTVLDRDGHDVGFLLCYVWDGAWYARAMGMRSGLRGMSGAFFNLAYYIPLSRAIEHGARRYLVGPSSLSAKLLRGARIEPRWSLLAARHKLIGDLDVLSQRWNDEQLVRWDSALVELGREPVSASWRNAAGLPAPSRS